MSPAVAMSAISRLRQEVEGRAYKPPNDPPSFVTRPWNSMVYEKIATTVGENVGYTIADTDILSELKARFNLSDSSVPVFKVQRASIWTVSTGPSFPLPSLDAVFYELTGVGTGGSVARSDQRDKGTLNRPAKAGYTYPLPDQKEISAKGDATQNICAGIAGGAGSRMIFHIHVLWKSQ
jgi:hypothetical protein